MITSDYDDSELEDRVFHAAAIGGTDPKMTREELNQLIRDLWTAYCEMEGRYIAVQEQYDAIEYRE